MGEYSLADDVLFIGHSLVGVEMPAMLQDVVESRGGAGGVRFQVINGAPLAWNWENSAAAQGVDARKALPDGGTEAVVLTEAVPLMNHTTWNDTNGNALNFYRLAVESNPQARVYLYETWHSLDSGTGVDVPHDEGDGVPWRERLDRDLPLWEGIVAHVNDNRAAGQPPMRLVPVGQAMGLLHDEIAQGSVPGVADIRQMFDDDIHPNDLGVYFATMVQFATLYGDDPRGSPRQLRNEWGGAFEAPSPELAKRLQEIAWEAVRRYSASQDIGSTDALPSDFDVGGVGGVEMAMGLAGISDWSTQQPFIDVMKSARPWIGHLPDRWGGWEHRDLAAGGFLDSEGWIRRIPDALNGVSTAVLTDQPAAATSLAGRYRLTYEGGGELRVEGRARVVRRRQGEVVFDYAPGEGSVLITLTATDPKGTGDHIRRIAIVKETNAALHAAGEVFNPAWLKRIGGLHAVRFMDWMATNDSLVSNWSERPRFGDYTYALRGVPLEVMLDLANGLGADPWFNMPHLADDAFMRAFAEQVRERLKPGLKAYVEYSNEIWNSHFEQAAWVRAEAEARWGTAAGEADASMQFAGVRAAQMAGIWKEAFGAEAGERLVTVLATQTGWLGLETGLLEAPLWTAENPGVNRPPAEQVDAYAVTGYFGGALGSAARAEEVRRWIAASRAAAEAEATARSLSGARRDAFLDAHALAAAVESASAELRDGSMSGSREDTLAHLICDVLPYQAEVARTHGLDLIMYEGGTHVVGLGPQVDAHDLTAFFTHLNYTPEMADLHILLRRGWAEAGGKLFNAYVDVAAPSKWGSWGALRHLDDENPRWDALFSNLPPGPVCSTELAVAGN